MKRGLKLFPVPSPGVSIPVEESAPMKRGLKRRTSRPGRTSRPVEESAPMKRGLKLVSVSVLASESATLKRVPR